MPDDDTTHIGGLPYDYGEDVHDANQAAREPDDDWSENVPPEKLWVHPDFALDAETLCDPDEYDIVAGDDDVIETTCAHAGCASEVIIDSPLTYAGLRDVDGVARCAGCDEPLLAHQQPPRDYHGGPGRGFGGGLP